MKIKTVLIGSILLLTIFLIYLTTIDRLVYFLALGDSIANGKTPYGNHDHSYNDYINDYLRSLNISEKYIDHFIDDDYRITDLIRDIEDNKNITVNNNKQSIKNALIKADLLTLSIGMNDLYYKLNTINLDYENLYTHIDDMIVDLKNLFILLRTYCKEDIFVLNYFPQSSFIDNNDLDEHFDYINKKLLNLCNKYKINYIEIDKILNNNKNFLPDNNSFLLNRNGHKIISDKIIDSLHNTLLKS